MSLTTFHNLTIKSFHDGLINKRFSALEIIQSLFKYIREKDKEIGAYLSINEEDAIKDAEKADLQIAKNEPIPLLAGIPIAIKDNILIKGMPSTAGSKILEDYKASYDATVIKRLRGEKAVFIGKTNMDEFAMGSSTENSAFKTTKNPKDKERVPGGSSGGSAAAVAANMAIAALGSDTGGSIRQPASFCGAVGFKPTYGAVSRYGLIAMASSLDQIGPITKTAEDAAILLNSIKGKDKMDSTSINIELNDINKLDIQRIKNFTIGMPKEYFLTKLDEKVEGALQSAVNLIRTLGIKTKEISLPHTKYAVACYYIIMPAEASANLARFDGIRYSRYQGEFKNLKDIYFKTRGYGFGKEVKRRIMLGNFVLSSGYYDAYYNKAQKIRGLIKEDFDKAFEQVDLIIAPTSPVPAFKIGEKTSDPLSMYLSDIFTIPASLAGLPSISMPIKQSGSLPIGLQIIGNRMKDRDVLDLGRAYEKIE